MSEMRNELKEFVQFQESVLRAHDESKGSGGWKRSSVNVLTSRMLEEVGEVLSHLFGQDHVCDFLISSLMDHVETSAVDLDYDKGKFRAEVADVANFCMMLHDIAATIDPHAVDDSPRA